MRRLFHSAGVVVLSIAATVLLTSVQTMTAFVALTATALIMGGTGHPLSTPQDSPEFINGYTADANNDYIVLTGFCGADSCTPTAVSTPEQFMPVSGTMPFDQSVGSGVTNLNQAINAQPAGESMVVFGYSQSARIASIEKGNLAAAGSTLPVSFVMIGNPNRPNGGILERFEGLKIPIAGITFDGATPTNTDFKTVDVTRQYDGWSDFPNNPLNPFATANAIAGINYLHSDYQSVGLGDALYQGSYGDTDYYMIPSQRLPLLMPLADAGVPSPVITILDAPARVLVESGYDRTISPGAPTKASILYFPNPVQTGVNFMIAIPTGLDDGAQEAANIRPFGTPPIDQRSPVWCRRSARQRRLVRLHRCADRVGAGRRAEHAAAGRHTGPGAAVGGSACAIAAARPGGRTACSDRGRAVSHAAGATAGQDGPGQAGDRYDGAVVEARRSAQARASRSAEARACRCAEARACPGRPSQTGAAGRASETRTGRASCARAAAGGLHPEDRAAEAGSARCGTDPGRLAQARRHSGAGVQPAGYPCSSAHSTALAGAGLA